MSLVMKITHINLAVNRFLGKFLRDEGKPVFYNGARCIL